MKNVHGGDIYLYKNVTDLSANINPLGTPESVMNSMVQSLGKINNYPDYSCKHLREKLAKKFGIEPEKLICGNGAADILFTLSAALCPKKALIVSPCFAEYEESLLLSKTQISYYDLKEENGYRLDTDYLSHLSADINIAFLCSPNNPTGITIDIYLLEQIAQKCKQNNTILVLDECFNDFLDNANEKSFLNKLDMYPNVVVLRSFTKIFAIAGVRLGYAVCSDEALIEKMYKYRQPWSVSTIAQAAGIACLDEDLFIAHTNQFIKKEREFLFEQLDNLNIKYLKSEVNYILFRAQPSLKEELLKYNILIRDCSNYKNLCEGYYRIAIKSHKDNVEFINDLKKISKRRADER